MKAPAIVSRLPAAVALLLLAGRAGADPRVSLIAYATPGYTVAKYTDGKNPKPETYVFMQGTFYEGATADRGMQQLPFMKIAQSLAPELAKQRYYPVKEIARADLVIVVHWGTTTPYVSTQEMTGRTSAVTDNPTNELAIRANAAAEAGDAAGAAILADAAETDHINQLNRDRLEQGTDQAGGRIQERDNAKLLGYNTELARLRKSMWSTEQERAMLYDLAEERYFITLKAYDLREKPEFGKYRPPVWTLSLNIGSSGNNFPVALGRLSAAGANFFGRTTDGVMMVRPGDRQGSVTIGPLEIVGEEPAPAKGKETPEKKPK